tara:strand:+ start:41544 stop:42410 length:867 start_codon:yes stop_codon:yes gene_type:complete
MNKLFDYEKAFSRNIGWLSKSEQNLLSKKRVAIAGAGGVGGEHLVTLLRLGIQNFNISDFDEFEVHNFNRQAGAFMSTIGRPKCEVMSEIAKDINPNSDIKRFDEGINESNVNEFLEGVDIYVDSLDFFAIDARVLLFKKCEEKGIPLVTAAPIGMGCAFLCFMPGKMSFEKYFRFNDCKNSNEKYAKFIIGLSPKFMKHNYTVSDEVDFGEGKGPSTPMGVKACGSIASTYVLKILLKRGKLVVAPHSMHFDAYINEFTKSYVPFGNRNPIQLLKFHFAKKAFIKKS